MPPKTKPIVHKPPVRIKGHVFSEFLFLEKIFADKFWEKSQNFRQIEKILIKNHKGGGIQLK